MRIEPDSVTPIFQQIVEGIHGSIAARVYRPGELIPSVRAQAVASLVNPNTVQRAYEQLERDGLITSKKGTGMIVAENATEIARQAIVQKITEAFSRGIAAGISAHLDKNSIDKIYRQAWNESRKQTPEVINETK